MKNKILLILFSLSLMLSSYFSPNRLHAQEDCTQLLNSAIEEFTRANFEGAIQILRSIMEQTSLYENCSLENREKINFYYSYCHYLLYGCRDSRTQKAICDFKLLFPMFDPNGGEYQWVSQDWINCWRNVECPVCDIIEYYYSAGRNFYSQKKYLLAAQELINARIAIDKTTAPPRNCPDYEEYDNFSKEYLNLLEEKLIDMWDKYFEEENYDECMALEEQLTQIVRYQDYLGRLRTLIDEKKAQLLRGVGNKNWENFKKELDSLRNPLDFVEVDFEELQGVWSDIKKYYTGWLSDAQETQIPQNAAQEILNIFKTYVVYVLNQYDISQEERVRQSAENFKNFIINNFPEVKNEAENEYKKIIDAPQPVFNISDAGVKPPEKDWTWRIFPPDCVIRRNVSGNVKFSMVINRQGKTEDIKVVEDNLSPKNDCSRRFIEDIMRYLRSRKFKPALKIIYKPARAPLPEKITKKSINVRFYFEKRFVLK